MQGIETLVLAEKGDTLSRDDRLFPGVRDFALHLGRPRLSFEPDEDESNAVDFA